MNALNIQKAVLAGFDWGTRTAVPILFISATKQGNAGYDKYRHDFAKLIWQLEFRAIKGGIGHNLPREVPQALAQAVIDVNRA
jgi:pimeloyl-ACP methyl ester carboxylesterase